MTSQISERRREGFAIEEFLSENGPAVLRAARRFSVSAADADDAYQRALEKLLTRRPESLSAEDTLPWLLTVARNEALMIARTRRRTADVAIEEVPDQLVAAEDRPDERVLELESLGVGREALMRINPDQARCLLLRADGLSYDEICAETGFSYPKVHRALFEGRRVYRGLLGRIESGAECRRIAPLLSLHVDGELGVDDSRDVEMHLENCPSCRVVTREFALAPRVVSSLFPVGALEPGRGFARQLADHVQTALGWLNERVAAHLPGTPGVEAATAKKVVLATAAAGTLIAGGVGYEISREDAGPAGTAAAATAARALAETAAAAAVPSAPAQRPARKKHRRSSKAATAPRRRATAADVTSAAQRSSNSSSGSAPRPASSPGESSEIFDSPPVQDDSSPEAGLPADSGSGVAE